MNRSLAIRVLEGLNPIDQIQLGLVAAQLAFVFWRRAFPEKEYQISLLRALETVEAFCATRQLAPDTKGTAELAYRSVSSCDLPSGDIRRSSGFSVAHLAMAPWLLASGRASKATHNAMVAIRYSESIHESAGELPKLTAALEFRARELRGLLRKLHL